MSCSVYTGDRHGGTWEKLSPQGWYLHDALEQVDCRRQLTVYKQWVVLHSAMQQVVITGASCRLWSMIKDGVMAMCFSTCLHLCSVGLWGVTFDIYRTAMEWLSREINLEGSDRSEVWVWRVPITINLDIIIYLESLSDKSPHSHSAPNECVKK